MKFKKIFEMQILNIATNARNLCDDVKKENLVTDMKSYFVGIAYLQETKIKNGLTSKIILCSPNKEDAYGLEFIVNEKWKNNIHNKWKGNDRIPILHLSPPNIKEPKKYTNPIYKKRRLVKG